MSGLPSANTALAVVALILFAVSTIWHIAQLCKYRQKFFIPFAIGGILQVFGYLFRTIYSEQLTIGSYIGQTLCILIAPIFYAASIYGLLEKLIVYVGAESTIPIKASRITCLFLTSDILTFFMQSLGGGMQASAANTGNQALSDRGGNIVVIGLVIQLVFFGFFMILALLFDRRTQGKLQEPNQGNWKLLLNVLEGTSLLLLIRAIYRLIEYMQGFTGFLMQHEEYFYLLDALMMLSVQIFYNVVYPGKILVQPDDAPAEGIEIRPIRKAKEAKSPQESIRDQVVRKYYRP